MARQADPVYRYTLVKYMVENSWIQPGENLTQGKKFCKTAEVKISPPNQFLGVLNLLQIVKLRQHMDPSSRISF